MNKTTISWMFALVATGFSSQAVAALEDDVKEKEMAVAALQAQVEPLVKPLMNGEDDLKVFVSTQPLVDAFAGFNSLPQASREITARSTGRNGPFWSDGGTWCGSYLELDESDSIKSTAVLSQFTSSVKDDGSIEVGSRVNVEGKGQFKFQFKGRRITRTIGICPACVRTNVCPPGGGVGTSIGVFFDKQVDLRLQTFFMPAADGQSVEYKTVFTHPDKISVTAETKLGPIGTLGVPFPIPVPKDPIAQGAFPMLITSQGKFQLPGTDTQREYSFVLTPNGFASTKTGITARWKSTVQFK